MSMRPYQSEAIESIRRQFSQGNKKVLLHLATGGGKTHIFSEILKRTAAAGRKCVMVVRGRQLVDQASNRLRHEEVVHGVKMAKHWNQNDTANVQVCSVDTLFSRGEFPPADLVVVDEAHLFVSKRSKEFLDHYNRLGAFVLAVTATPYTKESMKHLADAVVHPIGVKGLINEGYLVPPKYYAPSVPDLRGVRTVKGDYALEELEKRMNVLTGDIVEHWKRLGENRPTICFAVSIKHSNHLVAQFQSQGVAAEHIEGDTPTEEREAAIERLRRGEIKVLSNVGVLCTGVDIPFASAILMARPTQSYNLYIQQAGRGTRICPETGKQNFLLLDHAGNILRHGFITDEPEVELEGIKKKKKFIPKLTFCPECLIVFEEDECPLCGWVDEEVKEKKRKLKIESGVLKELLDFPKGAEISLFVKRMKDLGNRRGYKRGWAYYQTKEKYGEEIAERVFKKRTIPPWIKRRT